LALAAASSPQPSAGEAGALLFGALGSASILDLSIFGLLVAALAISILSLFGARPAKPVSVLPLTAHQTPLFADVMSEIGKSIDAGSPRIEAVWDATLTHHGQTIRVGLASLGNLALVDAVGLIARSVAAESSGNVRTITHEYRRLQALVDPPDNKFSL